MPKPIGVGQRYRPPKPKRTSQGLKHMPRNKHKKRNWKRYVGQGRP